MKPGRIPCLNPRCRRTAPAEKFAPGEEIICRKCWRALPTSMRQHHLALERRARRLARAVEKRIAQGTMAPDRAAAIGSWTERWLAESWDRIRAYYLAPERPEGLDAFLEQAGLV